MPETPDYTSEYLALEENLSGGPDRLLPSQDELTKSSAHRRRLTPQQIIKEINATILELQQQRGADKFQQEIDLLEAEKNKLNR